MRTVLLGDDAWPLTTDIYPCGFLLGLGVSDNAASAGDEMNGAYAGEWIGGHAEWGYDQGQAGCIAAR